MKRIEMAGLRFGRLMVLSLAQATEGEVLWQCRCDCGVVKAILGHSLRNGRTASCGCLRKEKRTTTATRVNRITGAEEKRRVLADPERRFWPHVRKGEGCWEWSGFLSANGYGKSGRRQYAHRLSWELANGPIPDGLYVCHRCDNPSCVRPDHLFVGTAADNAADMGAKGRSAFARHPEIVRRGEQVNTARLTEANVREIIQRLRQPGRPTLRQLAAEYGVAFCAIQGIYSGRAWKHVAREEFTDARGDE